MWFDEAVIYQIYPLGLCGAPLVNNGGECEEEAGNHRILRILDWIDHIKSMGTSCVLFFSRKASITPHENIVLKAPPSNTIPVFINQDSPYF